MLNQLDKLNRESKQIVPKEGQRVSLSSDIDSLRCPFLGDIEPEYLESLGDERNEMTSEQIMERYTQEEQLADYLFTLWIQKRETL